jgi:hypothetical protein
MKWGSWKTGTKSPRLPMKVNVLSAEPEGERRRSLIQSNTGFVGLPDFLLGRCGSNRFGGFAILLYSHITNPEMTRKRSRGAICLPSSRGCGTNRARPPGDFLMRRLVMAGLMFAVPSLAMAGSHAVHSSAPTARSAPAARSAPVMRSAPISRPMTHQSHQEHSFTPPRTLQHTPGDVRPFSSGSRTVFHTGGGRVFANPVRRPITRLVKFHGGVLALPALATLGAPVLLDVPDIGEVSVDEATYAALYPLLISDDEAERERAYVRLREQVERMPESLVRPANEISAGRPAVDTCPECPDTAEKFPICQPAGCDLAEVVFSKSHEQGRTVREKKVLPLR